MFQNESLTLSIHSVKFNWQQVFVKTASPSQKNLLSFHSSTFISVTRRRRAPRQSITHKRRNQPRWRMEVKSTVSHPSKTLFSISTQSSQINLTQPFCFFLSPPRCGIFPPLKTCESTQLYCLLLLFLFPNSNL